MNKKFSISKAIVFILFLIFAFSNISFSQQAAAPKFKAPYVNLDVLFAYSQPLPGLYGNVQDFFDFKNYGVKYGLGAQIVTKICTNKKGTIKPYLAIGYNLFTGSDGSRTYIDSNIINNGYPLPGNAKTYGNNPRSGTSKMYLHNFSLYGGFEYDFVNKSRWTPYLGAELGMNILFGTYRQTQDQLLSGGPGSETSFTINSATRFGFGAAAGLYLRVHQIIGFTFCTKYKFANLIGKSSDRLTDQNKMTLLDKSAPNLNSLLTKDRNINYFEFLLGISFYLGKR